MTTRHNPGPWRQNGSLITAQGAMGLVVCSVASKADARPLPDAAAKDFAQRDANARLIAAAPDLLTALENAVAQFDFTVSAMAKGQIVSLSSLQNCAAAARAAIAKIAGS